MIGLGNWIRAVSKMVRAPQEARLRRRRLPFKISPVPLQARKCRFVNDADDAFVFHSDEIGADQIVMRHVDHAVAGKCAQREKKKGENNTSESGFHARKIMGEIRNAKWISNESGKQENRNLDDLYLETMKSKNFDRVCLIRTRPFSESSFDGFILSSFFSWVPGFLIDLIRPSCRLEPARDRFHGVSATARCRDRAR